MWIGIDPGKTGAVAIIVPGWAEPLVEKMPKTERDIANVFDLPELKKCDQPFAMIEKVHSSPQMGVKSAFSFGQNYGFLRGCLIALGIPFDEVRPQRWMARLGSLTKGDKNVSLQRAQQLYPQANVNKQTADALLIAHYCKLTSIGEG